jgi:hypothetical protein
MSGVDWEKVRESLTGCSAHVCVIKKPTGMGTNGPCHCLDNKTTVQRFIGLLKHDLEQAKLTTSQVSEPVEFNQWYDGLFSEMKDKQVWENYQIKNIANMAWQAGSTTPQEAISPAIAEYVKRLETVLNDVSIQVKKWNLPYEIKEIEQALASKPTGLD